jgi:hypothetical protein
MSSRTPMRETEMGRPTSGRNYKSLVQCRARLSLYQNDRSQSAPIHQRLKDRVGDQFLFCKLAYCREWQMREPWRPLLFSAEE